MIKLINADCREALLELEPVRMVFADPPDNIGLNYNEYSDNLAIDEYLDFLDDIVHASASIADIVWISYNARYTYQFGEVVQDFLRIHRNWEAKPCVQTFTFYQYNKNDLGNAHRPLCRLMKVGTQLYPEAIKVPSWRQLHGDKRAAPGGKVPSDHFDYPRVVGNSKQRRSWHVTQLHEGLVERCVKLSCKPGDLVIDAFAGTGTVLRVCKRTDNPSISIELGKNYCNEIAKDNGLIKITDTEWEL